jgi:hypothetical protein
MLKFFIFLFFIPPSNKKIKKILFGWNDFLNDLFIYLTNIDSTCQGITIYDIIILCKNKSHPPKKKQFEGYRRKNLPIQRSFF